MSRIQHITIPTIILLICLSCAIARAQTYIYGSYTGTGSAKTITGMSFQPNVIIIKANATTEAFIKTSTMGATSSKSWISTGAFVTNAITAINSDGFTLGTNASVNTNGTTYYYTAFVASSSVKVGTYTGNGAAGPRNISVGFSSQGKFNIIIPATANAGVLQYTPDGTADGFYGTELGSTYNSSPSPAPSANGFDVYNARKTNVNTIVYHYISFMDVAGTSKISMYTSNATDNRNITGLGFQPDFMLISNSGANFVHMRTAANSADNTQYFEANANAANLIQSFAADGFQVGSGTTNTKVIVGVPVTYLAMGGGSALPIELLSFKATLNNNIVDLNWRTATEINNDFFTIEKTKDGTNFEFVSDIKGAGNSTSILNYSSIDDDPYEGASYYRLKQTDYNGTYTYSNLALIEYTKVSDFDFTIYPNPSDGSTINLLFTSSKNEEILVVVYGTDGILNYSKIIITQTYVDSVFAFDTSNRLPSGIYFITASSNKTIYRKKLIVR